MGGSRLSLVGAAEGAASVVDAVDSQTLSGAAGDREAAFADECASDGPAAEGPEDAPASTALWADQARVFAEAPHSGEDRSLGCDDTRIYGSGSGVALGEFSIGRVRAYPERHGHSQHLDGIAGPIGTRGKGRAAGPKGDRRSPAICTSGSGLGQRQ